MTDRTSFIIRESSNLKNNSRVLVLHKERPKWLILNTTALEIIRLIDKGENNKNICTYLQDKYNIDFQTAKQDVDRTHEELLKNGFLEKTPAHTHRQPSLRNVFFHLTSQCNLACHHCYYSNSPKNNGHLPFSVVKKCLVEAKNLGATSISFSGGEPFLHPNFKDIIKTAGFSLEIQILTNGTLINPEWASFLSDYDVFIQISVEGAQKEINDAIRGKGSFIKVLKAIEVLQAYGLQKRLKLATTISEKNINNLKDIVSLAEKLGIPFVRFLPLRKKGSAVLNWEKLGAPVRRKSYEDFFQYTSDFQISQNTNLQISCGLSGFMLKIPDEYKEDEIWCPIGTKLVISSNGDAYPCTLLMDDEFKLGNTHQSSLSEILKSKKLLSCCKSLTERRHKIRKCLACDWKHFCQAGCIGQALEHRKNIWKTDLFCDFRKKLYRDAFDRILNIENIRA